MSTAQATGTGQSAAAVTIGGMAFSLPTLTVKAGQKVTWTNNDTITHTVTADNGLWDSGNIAPGQSFSLTPTQTGQFGYHCTFHPFMQATLTVTS